MLNPNLTLIVVALFALVIIAAAMNVSRRQYLRSCRDRRHRRMARLAVLSFEEAPARNQTQSLAWQAFEASSKGTEPLTALRLTAPYSRENGAAHHELRRYRRR